MSEEAVVQNVQIENKDDNIAKTIITEEKFGGKLSNQKYVRFQEGSHYIQWDGVKCNRCLKVITIRAYYDKELSVLDNEFQRTAKCDCGVKIFKRNGIVVLVPKQIYNRNLQNRSQLTVADSIKINEKEKQVNK